MKRWKKIVLIIMIVLIAIQFIQPKRNTAKREFNQDISKTLNMPRDIHILVKTSCYDCHSNNTNYPWYAKVQPLGWWLAGHIKRAKAELNFNEFGSYSVRRQISKLNGIANSVSDKEMPLKSYTLLHTEARLSGPERQMIIDWATRTQDSLELKK